MARALAFKELRESAWIAAAALAAYVLLVVSHTGWDVGLVQRLPLISPFLGAQVGGGVIPFVSDTFSNQLAVIAALLAITLGFRQTLGEAIRGTYALLLHLPVPRRRLLTVKLLSGLTVYSVCTAVPVVWYASWAATPGTHASPFAWSMTIPAWQVWLGMTPLYLAAFLCGLRPARWVGSRLLPLVPAAGLALNPAGAFWWLTLILVVGLNIILWVCIQHVGRLRDFS